MSARPDEDRLAALLAQHRPPPMPDGLAARVAAAATAQPQEPPLASGGRGPRNRRGRWLRQPIVAGVAALGLAVSSAVAATYAGIPLPKPVERIIAELPFVSPPAPRERPAPVRAAAKPHIAPKPAPAPAPAEATPRPDTLDARMQRARAIVEARRAAGLPTPRADRIERVVKAVEARRAAGLPTPKADRIERAIERRRSLEQQGLAPAELDAAQRDAIRAEIGRRLLARRELVRRARAGDPQAIAQLQEQRRRQQERRARWRNEQEQPQTPSNAATEGFSAEPR